MTGPTSRSRLKEARRRLYRQAVLDAAEAIFAEAGYEAAKVSDIASGAGLSLATFYSVFDKKWDVYRAVHKRRLEELMAEIGSRPVDPDDLLRTFANGVETYLLFHMKHPEYLQMHLRERVAWTTHEGLRSDEQSSAWRAGVTMMMAGFELGISQGLFVADDTELMARTVIGMHQVRLALWIERGCTEPPAQLVDAALRQLIRALCPPERVAEFLAQLELSEERASA